MQEIVVVRRRLSWNVAPTGGASRTPHAFETNQETGKSQFSQSTRVKNRKAKRHDTEERRDQWGEKKEEGKHEG